MRTLGRLVSWLAYVVSDGPNREHKAFGEGFLQGQHITYDRVATYLQEEQQ